LHSVPAQDVIQNRVDILVAKLDERIQFTRAPGLPGEKFFKLLLPVFFGKSEPLLEFIKQEVNVHGLEMVDYELRYHRCREGNLRSCKGNVKPQTRAESRVVEISRMKSSLNCFCADYQLVSRIPISQSNFN
jgi:hypothetical protein